MQIEKKLGEELEWERYVSSDWLTNIYRPDINQEQQLTGLISKYKDNLNEKNKCDYNQYLNDIQTGEEVILELRQKQLQARADSGVSTYSEETQ